MNAYHEPYMQSCGNFGGLFCAAQELSGRVFEGCHNHERNVDSPQHTEDQVAMETVRFIGRIGAKEDYGGSVCYQTHGDSLCKGAHVSIHCGELQLIGLIIAPASAIFYGFNPQ